jgi:RNA polymerase sigma factor (sigma-70 family)
MTYPDERQKMIRGNMDLVHKIAGRIKMRVPKTISLSDLIGEGYVGLVEAASKYSRDRGASFRTYAGYRIVGAILDSLRRYDILSRGARQRANRNNEQHSAPKVLSLDNVSNGRDTWANTLIDPAPPVDSHMMRDEFPDRLMRSLQRSERDVLNLCFVRSYTTQRAAKHLGLSTRSILAIRARLLERARSYYIHERRDGNGDKAARHC